MKLPLLAASLLLLASPLSAALSEDGGDVPEVKGGAALSPFAKDLDWVKTELEGLVRAEKEGDREGALCHRLGKLDVRIVELHQKARGKKKRKSTYMLYARSHAAGGFCGVGVQRSQVKPVGTGDREGLSKLLKQMYMIANALAARL